MNDLDPSAGAGSRALQNLLDRAAIAQVANEWAIARDDARWERLRALYTPDATMHTTWFVGSASEFIERSIAAAKAGARVQHFAGASTIAIRGAKAIAEARVILMVRGSLEGIEVDVTCYGRFYDRLVKVAGEWLIQKRVPIYEKDRMDPVDPAVSISLDAAKLARYPAGYRHLVYLQAAGGAKITEGLPTPGSPELAQLYAEGDAWLATD